MLQTDGQTDRLAAAASIRNQWLPLTIAKLPLPQTQIDKSANWQASGAKLAAH